MGPLTTEPRDVEEEEEKKEDGDDGDDKGDGGAESKSLGSRDTKSDVSVFMFREP